MAKRVEQLHDVVVRIAGDSGDGMQLTGDRFTSETAALGNDLATLPDFPAEIRAPAGSLPGVSGFQLHFADHDILTPGDAPDVLVAMNPAALKTNLGDLREGGTLIANRDSFNDRNLQKAGYAENPLEDESLADFNVHAIPLTSMTVEALRGIDGVTPREAERSKNFFALGLMSWLYGRPTENTLQFIERKFAKRPEIVEANTRAFKTGYNYGETSEDFVVSYEVQPARLAPGTYRNITGNQALSLGLIAASVKSGLPLFLGAYPITPASGILEELARHKRFGVRTFQAEDEIAAVGAALGASFGGALGVSTSAGPGVVLKAETVGLANRAHLPHSGLSALRRVPGQRLRALAPARCRVAAGHRRRVRDCAERRRDVPAVRTRSRDARPPVGAAGHARPRAPDRRAREAGRDRQCVLRSRQPRPDDAATHAEDRRHRICHSRAGGGRSRRRRGRARPRLGRHVRADHRGRPSCSPQRLEGRPGAPPLPQPLPSEHRRRASPLRQGAR